MRGGRREAARGPAHQQVAERPGRRGRRQGSEGGMLRLETLLELKSLNSSFSSLSSYWNWTGSFLPGNSR